jgi:hypothetical protein
MGTADLLYAEIELKNPTDSREVAGKKVIE